MPRAGRSDAASVTRKASRVAARDVKISSANRHSPRRAKSQRTTVSHDGRSSIQLRCREPSRQSRRSATDAVIEWQQLKRPDPRVAAGRFVENDRCHKGRLYRHFATRKALAAATLKPPVRPLVLIGPCSTEDIPETARLPRRPRSNRCSAKTRDPVGPRYPAIARRCPRLQAHPYSRPS
jgi:hypothetical protein